MPAKPKTLSVKLPDTHRNPLADIPTDRVAYILFQHVTGETHLTDSQVQAATALLKANAQV